MAKLEKQFRDRRTKQEKSSSKHFVLEVTIFMTEKTGESTDFNFGSLKKLCSYLKDPGSLPKKTEFWESTSRSKHGHNGRIGTSPDPQTPSLKS